MRGASRSCAGETRSAAVHIVVGERGAGGRLWSAELPHAGSQSGLLGRTRVCATRRHLEASPPLTEAQGRTAYFCKSTSPQGEAEVSQEVPPHTVTAQGASTAHQHERSRASR